MYENRISRFIALNRKHRIRLEKKHSMLKKSKEIIKGSLKMDFYEYLKNSLAEDIVLKIECDKLQNEYELIENLINTRLESNLTQKELALKCGIKQSNISRLESGKRNHDVKIY